MKYLKTQIKMQSSISMAAHYNVETDWLGNAFVKQRIKILL